MIRQALLLLFLLGAAGCATLPRTPQGDAMPLTMEGLCSKYGADCGWDGVSQMVAMNYQGRRIQAMVGSSTVMVDEMRLILSAPLKRRHGLVVVPADFEQLVFVPGGARVREGIGGARRLGKIVVDAGHGGKDPGAIGFGKVREKDIALDIAMRVANEFRREGVDVILTRDRDEFISLADRTAIASCSGVEIFISIHANATKSRRANGHEVYYAAGLDGKDRLEDQRLRNEKKLCRMLNMKQDTPGLCAIVADMSYAYKMMHSSKLAGGVSDGLNKNVGLISRGSKGARYYVLRNTLVPAVLVEVGFISNPKDAARLKDGAYRQKIADAVTQSILRYMYVTR